MKTLLFILVSFIALTALISGLLMISNPDGANLNLHPGLLAGTPFSDFRIPGFILAGIVGGINLAAVFFNLKRHPKRYGWAMWGGLILTGWITGQVILTGAFHWLQLVYLATGILVILLSFQLKGKWVV